MACVKIEATEKNVTAQVEGTPLQLMGILGATTMECLAKIVEDIPEPFAGMTAKSFAETLSLQVMCKWGDQPEDDKDIGEKQPDQNTEEPKKPTPEEVLAMVLQLDDAGMQKLFEMTIRGASKRMQAEQEPKNDSKKGPSVGYAVFM